MIAGWLSAGRPQLAKGTWGSFDNWAAVVPQVIAFAGGANLHEARPKRGEGHDSETSAVLAVMGAIAALCRNAEIAGIKLAELIKRLYPVRDRREPPPPADGYDDARGAIESLVYVKPGFPPDAKALGKALRKYKGRIIGGRQLNAVTGHADTLLWSVADLVEAEGSEGSEGIPQAHAGKVSKYNSGVEYDSLGDSAMGQASKASQPSETETTGGAR
jgi:hypothetical protein